MRGRGLACVTLGPIATGPPPHPRGARGGARPALTLSGLGPMSHVPAGERGNDSSGTGQRQLGSRSPTGHLGVWLRQAARGRLEVRIYLGNRIIHLKQGKICLRELSLCVCSHKAPSN